MKKIYTYATALFSFGLLLLSHTAQAAPRCFLKNGSNWDISMKFAQPGRKAVESPIKSNGLYYLGGLDDLTDVVNLSVRRDGAGSDYISGFTALEVQKLKADTRAALNRNAISGYEKDIYWTVMPTWTGWTAKVETIQRLSR